GSRVGQALAGAEPCSGFSTTPRRSHATARNRDPVGLVECELAQVPEPIGGWGLRWMVVVELQQGTLAVPHLEEAHHLAGVGAFLEVRRPTLDRRSNPFGHDGCLEVSRGARLGER